MLDDARVMPPGTHCIDADVCIIGAGAAGIVLALQFVGTSLRVLLVESGGRFESASTQDLYRGEVVDEALHPPAHQYRHRVFGGSTVAWGGRCVPFDPIDFEPRAWIPRSGWPIGYDEVLRHYSEALRWLEAGDFQFDARHAVNGGMRPMLAGFAPTMLSCETIERFSCPTNFASRYGERLVAAPNIRVLLNANCVLLSSSGDGRRIASAMLRSLSGTQIDARATVFVIATGGLEIPRLLLASANDRHPRGLGNHHDNVGRYYMCHIAGTIGEVEFHVPPSEIWHGYDRSWDGVYCRRRISVLPEVQRRFGIGNAVYRFHHPRLADYRHRTGVLSLIYLARPLVGYEYAKRLHGSERPSLADYLHHVLNVARSPVTTSKFLLEWTWIRTLAARKFPSLVVRPTSNTFSIDVHSEQAPNPASRVTLAEQIDALGMRRLRIDWRHSAVDMRTVEQGLHLLGSELEAWGGAKLRFNHDEVEHCMLRDGAFGGHHSGTARMSRSPDAGVVDVNCKVHDIDNLYLGGSAVFPTSSQANPTLTIVALALRLARHLRARLEPSPAMVTTECTE